MLSRLTYEPIHVYRHVYKHAYILLLVYILVYMYVYTYVYMYNYNQTKGNYEAYECYLGLPMLILAYFTCMIKPRFLCTFTAIIVYMKLYKISI